MNDEYLVSIICTTFNHGNFIQDAINSFINQKTNFRYEIIIHDDASTDSTKEIITKFAEMYPEKIVPVLQNTNQYKKGGWYRYKSFIEPIIRGKYIAYCEGDDYWIDENKLQIQVDYLESNQECSMVVHASEVRKIDGTLRRYIRPYVQNTIIQEKDLILLDSNYDFALSSVMIREKFNRDWPEFRKTAPFGGYPMRLHFATQGYIYYFDRYMSVYREGVPGSWTTRRRGLEGEAAKKSAKELHDRVMKMMTSYDSYTKYKFHYYVSQKCLKNEFFYYYRYFPRLLREKKYSSLKSQLSIKRRVLLYINILSPSLFNGLLTIKKKTRAIFPSDKELYSCNYELKK